MMNSIGRYILGIVLVAVSFTSCTKPGAGEGTTNPLVLTVSDTLAQVGLKTVTFKVEYEGIEVTSRSEIYCEQTDPSKLEGNTFMPENPGNYTFYAIFDGDESTKVTVMAIDSELPEIPEDPAPESTDFHRRALLVQFTGIGCSFCPMSDLALDALMEGAYGDEIVWAACHSRDLHDPAYYDGPLKDVAKTEGITPYVCLDIDSDIKWKGAAGNEQVLLSEYVKLIDQANEKRQAKAGISASSTYDGESIHVAARIKAGETNEYKVTVWILENGIFGKQVVGPGIQGNFDIHDKCIRHAEFTGSGETADYTGVSYGTIEKGKEVEKTFSIPVGDGWNTANCYAVIIVSVKDGETFSVNNSVECELYKTVEYRYN